MTRPTGTDSVRPMKPADHAKLDYSPSPMLTLNALRVLRIAGG